MDPVKVIFIAKDNSRLIFKGSTLGKIYRILDTLTLLPHFVVVVVVVVMDCTILKRNTGLSHWLPGILET